ncbi:MAG: carboxypeptidase-like regulatory domain-containing protein [Bacteroidia bacterium]|nr:carboxypeptidase-like regulatory domain-containing protein [Bacteroidia bacterium]
MKIGRLIYRITPGVLLLLHGLTLPAQVTKIMGSITDASTKEPLPFTNVVIAGTTIGTLTDFNGKYSIEFTARADSVRASLIGYAPLIQKITLHQFQAIDFALQPESYTLEEVTIRYRGNPAEKILDKVIANKKANSLQSFSSYHYEAYTKIELDANNISEKLKQRKMFKQFEFIFSFVDTSTINGKSYLPVLITETVSDVYFRKSPKARKEIIKASRISGLENESVAQFLGNLSEQIDVYKDHIPIFEKNFVSPIAEFGLDFYKYYLVDSTFLGNNWCYHIMFKPRRKQELTFTGSFWVADTSFAIKKIDLRIVSDANINFINDLAVKQEFDWTDNQFWMITRDEMIADFNIIENTDKVVGFFGHRTSSYRNFQFDPPENKRFLALPANVFIEDEANQKEDSYWEMARHEELTESEQGIYEMVDSIKKIPIFNTYVDIIYTAVNGYMPWGKVELGPYTKLFSFNTIEGARFRIGGRTSNSFSKKIQLEAYLAYGTKDQRFKYGGEVMYMFNKNPRRDMVASYKHDLEQLGLSPNAFSTDNILSSLFHRGPNDKLTRVHEVKIMYEHEWFNGLINRLHFIHRQMFPLGGTSFEIFSEGNNTPELIPDIFTSEVVFDTRIAFRERFVSGEFYRFTISSSYPIILLRYAYGIPNLFQSDYEYHKLSLNLQQWFNFSTVGWSKYTIEAGKIWGTLPYPLLKIHEGNQTFLYDEFSSNLMNYYEFVSDQYISVNYTHHFDGLLFNHLPLIRKLKWREVAHLRCVYGTLKEKNQEYSLFPGQMRSFGNIPYWEAGVGIENIFRIIRVDAIWRLNHLDDRLNPNPAKFGLFISLYFSF